MRIKKEKKQGGFSLMEVVVASAIMAGLGLVIAQLSQNADKVIKTTDVRLDYLTMKTQIVNLLSDPDACKETLDGVDLSAGGLVDMSGGSAGTTVNNIRNKAGTAIYTVGNDIGNSLNLLNFEVGYDSTLAGASNLEKFQTRISFSKINAATKTYGPATFRDNIKVEIIQAPGGDPNLFEKNLDSCSAIRTGSDFNEFDALATVCNGDWAFKELDSSGQPICNIGPVPQSLRSSSFDCPTGQFINKVEGTGSFECNPILATDFECGTNEYVTGISTSGQPICQRFGVLCEKGETLSHYDLITGAPVCLNISELFYEHSLNQTGSLCANGQILLNVQGKGFICVKSSCPDGFLLKGFDGVTGNTICENPYYSMCGSIGSSGTALWSGAPACP